MTEHLTPSRIAEMRQVDPLGPENRCRDFDEDCDGIECKTGCWLYDPEQGWCPYLLGRPTLSPEKQP